MLYKDPFITAQETLLSIQKLQELSGLSDFFLAGETSLAFQWGHRHSKDIDLFTQNSFSVGTIIGVLLGNHSITITMVRPNTILAVVDNIKTDFIRHGYPFIKPPITEEEIRFLGMEDIAAMKLHAIVQSGKRLKDFIDIYFILEHFTMAEIVGFYEEKYSFSNAVVALKALNYFDEIDEEIDPPKMITTIPLLEIQTRLRSAIVNPYITF